MVIRGEIEKEGIENKGGEKKRQKGVNSHTSDFPPNKFGEIIPV